MANQEYLTILKQGVEIWNKWRRENPDIEPDLSEAKLSGANLRRANLRRAKLTGASLIKTYLGDADLSYADLSYANLSEAKLGIARLNFAYLNHAHLHRVDLCGANLVRAELEEANLSYADLSYANLTEACLVEANLRGANLKGANLSRAYLNSADLSDAEASRANFPGANFTGATLVRANLAEAILTDCRIYGISAWNVELKGAKQNNLVITPKEEPAIAVDNLKIAQFIYLLLNNAEIREVIDTIAKKAVLILGRFTPERKTVLDALREVLRTHEYLPILFDFEKPASRDITETVSTLAHLSRFVIADITDAKSIPQELMMIVPSLPSVPVQPLILESQREYGMFEHFIRFPWVLPIHYYQDLEDLLASFQAKVIAPAEQKAQELEKQLGQQSTK